MNAATAKRIIVGGLMGASIVLGAATARAEERAVPFTQATTWVSGKPGAGPAPRMLNITRDTDPSVSSISFRFERRDEGASGVDIYSCTEATDDLGSGACDLEVEHDYEGEYELGQVVHLDNLITAGAGRDHWYFAEWGTWPEHTARSIQYVTITSTWQVFLPVTCR